MKTIGSKLSMKLILFQIGFLYFFSQAADRLYYSWNYEISECMYQNGIESGLMCLDKHPGYTVTGLLVGHIYYMFGGFLLGFLIIGIVNRIKKKHVLNVILVLILYVLLWFGGAFKFTHSLDMPLISFTGNFTQKY